eukprot:1646322-Prymnesium_polylepis.1
MALTALRFKILKDLAEKPLSGIIHVRSFIAQETLARTGIRGQRESSPALVCHAQATLNTG